MHTVLGGSFWRFVFVVTWTIAKAAAQVGAGCAAAAAAVSAYDATRRLQRRRAGLVGGGASFFALFWCCRCWRLHPLRLEPVLATVERRRAPAAGHVT